MEDNYYPMTTVYKQRYACTTRGTIPREDEIIEFMVGLPAVKWAIDNSLNKKYYVTRDVLKGLHVVTFRILTFLDDEQTTFWRLKFGGR